MAISWMSEAMDLRPDPDSGAKITRLTSAPCINNNIYCEQPYSSPDGQRIVFVRYSGTQGVDALSHAFVADLPSLRIAPIPGVQEAGRCHASWGEWVYYHDAGRRVMAFSLKSLEHRVVLSAPNGGPWPLGALSPDERYSISTRPLPGPTLGIERLDLHTGEREILYTHPEITNPHLQYNPVHGRQMMVQRNVGSELYADGRPVQESMGRGCTLMVIDVADGTVHPLPVGEPYTAACTGHECFVADTGRICFTAHWNWATGEMDSRYPEGNLFTVAPGETEPRVFVAPEHRFNHVCVSRCGRYFLADSYGNGLPGEVPLVIGNLQTGKYRSLLRDCGASCGGAQFTHPHAYITADNRRVVYNADPLGIPHLHMATIPEAFLASLD